MSNRIQALFEVTEKAIQEAIQSGSSTQDGVEITRQALDMDFEEFMAFQGLKSHAVSMEKITVEEGQTIYAALGGQPSTFNGQPVHVKMVLTAFFKHLLEEQLAVA